MIATSRTLADVLPALAGELTASRAELESVHREAADTARRLARG